MKELLLCSLIVSLFTLGLKISTGDGMILEWPRMWLDSVFIKIDSTRHNYETNGYEQTVSPIYYPILYCIKCMPSIYGTLISLLLLPFTLHLLYQIPLIIFCSVTLNCVIYQMYE